MKFSHLCDSWPEKFIYHDKYLKNNKLLYPNLQVGEMGRNRETAGFSPLSQSFESGRPGKKKVATHKVMPLAKGL